MACAHAQLMCIADLQDHETSHQMEDHFTHGSHLMVSFCPCRRYFHNDLPFYLLFGK